MKNKNMLFILFFVLVVLLLVVFYFFQQNEGFNSSFTIPGLSSSEPKDSEGYRYETVEIGEQVWFAENLRTAEHAGGDSWCYENDPQNCEVYGRLYNWDAALKACPSGWNLPSDEDWSQLEAFIDNSEMIGSKLKTVEFWQVDEELKENFRNSNEYDFGILPSGHYVEEYFYDLGLGASFWTSTKEDDAPAWSRVFMNEDNSVSRGLFGEEHGFSVRCIKD